MATGRLDQDDLGAQVGEETAGQGRRLPGEVDDLHSFEQGRRHVVLLGRGRGSVERVPRENFC